MLAMTLSAPRGGGGGGPRGGGMPRGGRGGGAPRMRGPRHPGPFHPYGRGGGRGLGPYHPYGRGGRGGWWPGYNYGPEVVVVPPVQNCQFTILMPTGEQIIVRGTCPVAITTPVQATIAPL